MQRTLAAAQLSRYAAVAVIDSKGEVMNERLEEVARQYEEATAELESAVSHLRRRPALPSW